MTTTTENRADMAQANAAIGLNLVGVGLVFLADNVIARQPLGLMLLAAGAALFLWARRREHYPVFTLSLAFAGVGLWFLLASALSLTTVLGLSLGGSAGREPVSLIGVGLPLLLMVAGAIIYLRKDRGG